MTYAATTTVPIEKSKMEIERMLTRYGASKFASGWDATGATILFECAGRRVRFVLPLPIATDPKFARRDSRRMDPTAALAQASRARWRSLALCIKAKLEAVESGIESFESAFLAHVVLPGGETVGTWIEPQLTETYATGRMPPLLPSASTRPDPP